jgi:hypothetical protein
LLLLKPTSFDVAVRATRLASFVTAAVAWDTTAPVAPVMVPEANQLSVLRVQQRT